MKSLPKKNLALTIHKTISTIRDFESKDLKKLIKRNLEKLMTLQVKLVRE